MGWDGDTLKGSNCAHLESIQDLSLDPHEKEALLPARCEGNSAYISPTEIISAASENVCGVKASDP